MSTKNKFHAWVWPWGALVVLLLPLIAPISHWACLHSDGGKQDVDKVVAERGEQAVIAAGELCNESKCAPALLFHGGVNEVSMKRLREAFDKTSAKWVCLESPGGDMSAGQDMAKEIRKRHLGTCVTKRKNKESKWTSTECGSICATIWMGGEKRILGGSDALVGVHAPFIGASKCCVVDNFIASSTARAYLWWEGLTLGDYEARKVLWNKGSQCSTNEFYAVRAHEAINLKLVDPDGGTLDWYWKPKDESQQLDDLVRANDCKPKVV